MSPPPKSEITIAKWDRYSRATTMVIDQKEILTPCFATHVKNLLDFTIYRDVRAQNSDLTHCGMCIMPFYLASKIMGPLLSSVDQRTLSGKYLNRPFIEQTVFAFDPCTEFMTYSSDFTNIVSNYQTPTPIKKYFQNTIQDKRNNTISNVSKYMREQNDEFWTRMISNTTESNNMVLTDFENAKLFGANMYLTRVPLITSNKSFEHWRYFDALGKKLWHDGLVTTYLPCSKDILYRADLFNDLINFITEDTTPITIIKIKDLNLVDPDKYQEFQNYKLLLEHINGIKLSRPSRSFILLEGGYQTYPSVISGFDVVSTSLRGTDADFVRSGKSEEGGYGKFFHPRMLINLRYSHIVDAATNGTIDCNCIYCNDVKLDAITKDFWNALRRQHALFIWNKLMGDLNNMIQHNNVEDATEKVLENSRLKILKDVVQT